MISLQDKVEGSKGYFSITEATQHDLGRCAYLLGRFAGRQAAPFPRPPFWGKSHPITAAISKMPIYVYTIGRFSSHALINLFCRAPFDGIEICSLPDITYMIQAIQNATCLLLAQKDSLKKLVAIRLRLDSSGQSAVGSDQLDS